MVAPNNRRMGWDSAAGVGEFGGHFTVPQYFVEQYLSLWISKAKISS